MDAEYLKARQRERDRVRMRLASDDELHYVSRFSLPEGLNKKAEEYDVSKTRPGGGRSRPWFSAMTSSCSFTGGDSNNNIESNNNNDYATTNNYYRLKNVSADDTSDDDDSCYSSHDDVATDLESVTAGQEATRLWSPDASTCSSPRSPDASEDFNTRRTRLQEEAKVALAQAQPMARMQLEIEKQAKKKSPVAEIVGIPNFGDVRRCHLSRDRLRAMNPGELQLIANDFLSQIEALNEELVKLLIERDDLNMEQDSFLVDIDDLTRKTQECAVTAGAAIKLKPVDAIQ